MDGGQRSYHKEEGKGNYLKIELDKYQQRKSLQNQQGRNINY
jgi:hypothetical protein